MRAEPSMDRTLLQLRTVVPCAPGISPKRSAPERGAAEPAPPGRSRRPLEGVTRSGAGVFRYPGRFIWQLVGVLDT